MPKIICGYLSSGRHRRYKALKAALWLLRQILDVEKDELWRNCDMLEELEPYSVPYGVYSTYEEMCEESEYAVAAIESAIEELEYVY